MYVGTKHVNEMDSREINSYRMFILYNGDVVQNFLRSQLPPPPPLKFGSIEHSEMIEILLGL